MEKTEVKSIYGRCHGKSAVYAQVPGSKSITNRALLLAALAQGESVLTGAFVGGDFHDLMNALKTLGVRIEADEEKRIVRVWGNGRVEHTDDTVFVGNAGTAARFITALLGCIPGSWRLDAAEQMRKRPMGPLLEALREMGCLVICENEEGHFPFRLQVPENRKHEVTIDINASSQFLSALLIAGAVAEGGLVIKVRGNHGMAYVDMTEKMMHQFGIDIEKEAGAYHIAGDRVYKSGNYAVEPDMSAACYFYAAAAILGTRAGVRGVTRPSLQGDMAFLDVLKAMGCSVTDCAEGMIVTGPEGGNISGTEVDMHSFSDQALTLAAIAPFASGDVVIRNVGHIRGQECDRVAAIENELSRIGVKCEVAEGNITIHPARVTAMEIETYGDHRVAMSFGVTGLRSGMTILDPKCTSKTFAGYFDEMKKFSRELVGRE